jgi:hypothetical protein
VAGGLAASVAAAGLAAAPAGAITSGTIYACYSDKTQALYHSTASGTCAAGFTRISWNAQGPQGGRGPQGAQGHQGVQGAQGKVGGAAGYTDYRSTPKTLSRRSSGVVASLTPAVKGAYAVRGMAVVNESLGTGLEAGAACRERSFTSVGSSSTPWASADIRAKSRSPKTVTLATNGILFGGPESVIVEICTGGFRATVQDAALTAVQVSTAHHASKPLGLRPRNRISVPPARGKGARPGAAVGAFPAALAR